MLPTWSIDFDPDLRQPPPDAASGSGDCLLAATPPADTFPARGIWYQEIHVQQGAQVNPVNFGWDYQLK